jgi:hypothetical protein
MCGKGAQVVVAPVHQQAIALATHGAAHGLRRIHGAQRRLEQGHHLSPPLSIQAVPLIQGGVKGDHRVLLGDIERHGVAHKHREGAEAPS